MSADAPAAELNYTPKPPAEPSAPDVVRSIEEKFRQDLAGIHKAFAPQISMSVDDIFGARQQQAQAQQGAVAAGQRYLDPRPQPPLPQFQPQPPVRDISPRPFMDNPQAKDTLGNVVSLLGTMAQMAMAGRAPVAALNAFSGAMTGWAEGDRVRAQRDWQQYLAQVDKINADNITAQRWWEDAQRQHGANELAAQAQYIVALDTAGMKERATEAARGQLRDFLGMQEQYIGHAEKLRDFSLNASKYVLDFQLKEEMKHQNRLHQLQQEKKWEEELVSRRKELGLRDREVVVKEGQSRQAQQGQDLAKDPELLDWMANRIRGGEDPNQVVRGIGQSAGNVMMNLNKHMMDQEKAAGNDAGAVTVARRFLQANTQALKKVTTDEAQFKTFLTSFEQTVSNARRLADQVEKSGMPVWDRKLLWLEAKVNGNEAANNLLGQMEVLAREADRVLARARGVGSVTSQQHARELLDPGLTSKQFHSLIDNVLTPDALYSAMGFEAEKKKLLEAIQNPIQAPGKAMSTPSQAPSPKLPPHTKLEGGQLVSEDGKYMWKDGKWQSR